MGEYADWQGGRIKVGTCEDMYYLRADQVGLIQNSETDFADAETMATVRFRFPWPDEDGNAPGSFEDYARGLRLSGFELPEMEHGSVQFSARNGYLVSLPCPEGPEPQSFHIGRNGYGGAASLVQQAWRGGRLVGIVRCNGCEALARLEDGAEDLAAIAIRTEADRLPNDARRDPFHRIADRLLAGYALVGAR